MSRGSYLFTFGARVAFLSRGSSGSRDSLHERDNDCTFEIIIIQFMILDQWDLRLKGMLCYVGAHDKHLIPMAILEARN